MAELTAQIWLTSVVIYLFFTWFWWRIPPGLVEVEGAWWVLMWFCFWCSAHLATRTSSKACQMIPDGCFVGHGGCFVGILHLGPTFDTQAISDLYIVVYLQKYTVSDAEGAWISFFKQNLGWWHEIIQFTHSDRTDKDMGQQTPVPMVSGSNNAFRIGVPMG